MPPKTGAILRTVSTISSTSVQSKQIGKALTLANFLNSMALPSITGNEAKAPMFPRPKTAVPFVTTAIVLFFIVRS